MSALAGLLGVASAFVFTASFALQQRANLRVMVAGTETTPGSETSAVVRQPDWIAGMALQVVGFALQAVALGIGALAVVQPALVTAIIFMVPFSAWVVHGHTNRRDWHGALLVLAGLIAFEGFARPETARDSVPIGTWWVPAMIVLAGFALLMAVGQRIPSYRAALWGAAVGVWGGMLGAVAKQAVGDAGNGFGTFLTGWSPWALLFFGVVNVLWLNLALRAGRLASSQATMAALTPVASLYLAAAIFDEQFAHDPLALAGALAGAAVCGAGVALLARSPSLVQLGAVTERAHPGRIDP